MTCKNSTIIILPAGCLGHQEIDLQCKAPEESVHYQFSLANRLAPNDRIMSVSAWPSDETVGVDQVEVNGQTFKARISGGTINTKSGIRFLVSTRSGETREFVVTLPVSPAGILGTGTTGNYVLGDTGPEGKQGKAATITIGKVLPTDPDSDPKVENTGTDMDAILNFTLPRGAIGPEGQQGPQGEKGDKGDIGEVGPQGKAGTQILQSNRDPVKADAKENIVWLNTITGDLFETVPAGNDQYTWNKTGNLKGKAGNVIYSGVSDPVLNAVYKENDLYFNSVSDDVFVFNSNQWTKIANLKGEKGTRGSLFFYNSQDPVTAKSYNIGDCYLNSSTYDFFVYNGDNWQKVGNLKGAQGDKGEQGETGSQGIQGPQGETGKEGAPGIAGKDGTRIITSKDDPEENSGNINANVIWINTTTWNVKRTIEQNGSWQWIDLGVIKGEAGQQGVAGKSATVVIGNVNTGDKVSVTNSGTDTDAVLNFVLPKGEKGDDGSRWYSGNRVPDDAVGMDDPRGAPRPGDSYLFLDDTNKAESTYIYTNTNKWAGPLATVYGPAGKAATINVNATMTVSADQPAKIVNVGTENNALLNFEIPQGAKGDTGLQGPEGKSATIRIASVMTGAAGSEAKVENVGTEQDVRLNIVLPQGMKGDTGLTGPQGVQGLQGVAGKNGDSIAVGQNDPSGNPMDENIRYWLNSASGDLFAYSKANASWVKVGNLKGIQGDKGDVGPAGPQGIQGLQGVAGKNGDSIAVGQNDPSGNPMDENIRYWLNSASGDLFAYSKNNASWVKVGNLKGVQGDKGDIGPAGPQGIQGLQGLAGKNGDSIAVGQNDPSGNPTDENIRYWLNSASGDLFTYSRDNASWVKIGNLKGIQGDKGDTGPAGEKGEPGRDGQNGRAATLSVGSVVTGDPDSKVLVTNTGTESEAVFSFSIPKGEKGETGPIGLQGPQGEKGADGKDGVGIQYITPDFSSSGNMVFTFVMTDGTSQTISTDIYKGYDKNIFVPNKVMIVPDDFTVNGSLYIAPDAYVTGTKVMPEGLSLNGNLVLTDGSVFYQNTYNNGGVLCVA